MRLAKAYAYEADDIDEYRNGGKPAKPGMSPVLIFSLGMWASCAVAYSCMSALDRDCITLCAFTCLVIAGVSFIICCVSLLKKPMFICLSISIGICFASLGAYTIVSTDSELFSQEREWQIVLLEDASAGSFGSQAAVELTDGNRNILKVRANFVDSDLPKKGDEMLTTVALRQPKDQEKEYFWFQGYAGSISISEYTKIDKHNALSLLYQARNKAIELIGEYGGDQASLIQALACGYRNTMKESGIYELYKTTGLAHIVAVSGAHLSIVSMMLGWALERLRAAKSVKLAIIGIFLIAYLIFAGIPISAIRAAIMAILSLSSFIMQRRNASLNALGIALIVFIATDPVSAVSVSLFLSAASTLGIILFADLISSWFGSPPKTIKNIIVEPLALTMSSNLLTQPFSVALFSQLPLIAPLANIVVAPLFLFACISSLAATVFSCIVPEVSSYVIEMAKLCVSPLSLCVSFLAFIPYSCISLVVPLIPMILLSCVACVTLWMAWPSFSPKVCAAISGVAITIIAFMLTFAPYSSGNEIIMLDVGQGDAFLIRSKGSSVLIDTGNKDAKLKEALARASVYKLDAVIISHHDDDHCGSLGSLSGYVNIGEIYTSSFALSCDCENCRDLSMEASKITDGLNGLDIGDKVVVGDFTLKVVWPKAYEEEGGNADSLCLLATLDHDADGIDEGTALFLGDAEYEELDQIINSEAVGEVDILKVGHHGSRVALSESTMEKLRPQTALISVGENNRYGHPAPETLTCLQNIDCSIFRTDEDGSVTLSFDRNGISANQSKREIH